MILPLWSSLRDDVKLEREARSLVWEGVPPSIRQRLWALTIGNQLQVRSTANANRRSCVRSVVACVCACVLAGVAVDGRHCLSTQPPALGCVLQVTQQLFEISCSHARRARAEAAAGRADAYLGYEGSVKVRCSIRCCGASRA